MPNRSFSKSLSLPRESHPWENSDAEGILPWLATAALCLLPEAAGETHILLMLELV